MLGAPLDPTTPRARRRALLALGVYLSRRGVLATISIGIALLTVLGAIALTFLLAGRGERAPLERLPALTASGLAWGAGILVAFSASVQAMKRDREGGLTALLRARGASVASYVWTRVGGLTIVLAILVAGGTLLTGMVAMLLATRTGIVLRTAQGTLAAVAYAIAFSATLGPLAMAALGSRSRAGGYIWLLVILVLPELLSPLTSAILPNGWRELASIPGALHALCVALMPPGIDVWRGAKALFVIALVVAACLVVVRRATATAQAEEAP